MEEVTPAPARARLTRLQAGIAGLASAFVVLAVLVAAGRLDSLDHYAVVHWMPGLDPAKARDTVPPVKGVFMPFDVDEPWWHRLLDLVMYPASVLLSVAVFGLGLLALWRRGARVAAIAWGVCWVATNAVEVIAKAAIAKPDLYRTKDGVAHHLSAFDHSFPSGHAVRGVLVAGFVAYVWTRLGRAAAAWVVVMTFCLVAASWHVPSDVAGGLILGLLAVFVTQAVLAARLGRRG